MTAKELIKTTTTSLPDRRLWGLTDKFSVKGDVANGMFTLGIVALDKDLKFVKTDIQLDPAARSNNAVYQFPVAPSSYEVTENAATQIVPTQDGGMFIESQGNLFKDIKIAGTVGFRPNVPSTALLPAASSAGLNTSPPGFLNDILFNDERGLNKKEATGFDDIIFLRNLFRYYFDLKGTTGQAHKIAMVWTYVKESETYIVEPVSFSSVRDSSSPLSWKYSIQLRTIAMLKSTFTVVEDPLNIFTAITKSLQFIDKVGRDLGRALNQFASIVNYVTSLPFKLAESLINAGLAVLNGISAIRNSFDFKKLKKGHVTRLRARANEAFSQIVGGQLRQGQGDTVSSAQFAQSGATGQGKHLASRFIALAEGLLSVDFLWQENPQAFIKDRSNAYDNEYGESPITFGSPLNPANINIGGSASEEKIIAGENIRTLANRLTGDEANWKMLAIANNLKAPYIAPVASPGVLGYGDYVLVPQATKLQASQLKTMAQLDEDATYQSQTPAQRRYGRDIKLLEAEAGGNLADLSVTKQGDLELVEGALNVGQAVMIKFATEQGSLSLHPSFGASFPIGTKFPRMDKLHEFSLNAQRTIRQDPRVDQIDDIRIYVSADSVYFSAKLKLILSDVVLPITFAVRR